MYLNIATSYKLNWQASTSSMTYIGILLLREQYLQNHTDQKHYKARPDNICIPQIYSKLWQPYSTPRFQILQFTDHNAPIQSCKGNAGVPNILVTLTYQ